MTVKFTIELSDEMGQKLEEMATKMQAKKVDVLRKSLTLMNVAVSAKEEGKHFGVATKRENLETEIVGV